MDREGGGGGGEVGGGGGGVKGERLGVIEVQAQRGCSGLKRGYCFIILRLGQKMLTAPDFLYIPHKCFINFS